MKHFLSFIAVAMGRKNPEILGINDLQMINNIFLNQVSTF